MGNNCGTYRFGLGNDPRVGFSQKIVAIRWIIVTSNDSLHYFRKNRLCISIIIFDKVLRPCPCPFRQFIITVLELFANYIDASDSPLLKLLI